MMAGCDEHPGAALPLLPKDRYRCRYIFVKMAIPFLAFSNLRVGAIA
jgi:hypothetical protein